MTISCLRHANIILSNLRVAPSQVTKMSLRSPDPLYTHTQEGCDVTWNTSSTDALYMIQFVRAVLSENGLRTPFLIKCCTTSLDTIQTMWICQVYIVLLHAFQHLFCMTCWGPSFWYNVVKWNSTPRCSNWLLYSNCRSLNIQFKLELTIKEIWTRIARLVKLDLSIKD